MTDAGSYTEDVRSYHIDNVTYSIYGPVQVQFNEGNIGIAKRAEHTGYRIFQKVYTHDNEVGSLKSCLMSYL